MFGLRDEIIDEFKKVVKKYNYEFYIFGSRARGDYKKNSDIDIAVKGKVEKVDEYNILNDFDNIDMEYIIDIVFIDKLESKALLENIKNEGVRI